MNKFIINEEFLQQVEILQTILKNNTSGLFGGNHQSKTYGSSCEFADYRDYIPGDDITKIDWNAYARFEKLYLKLSPSKIKKVPLFTSCLPLFHRIFILIFLYVPEGSISLTLSSYSKIDT